MPFASKARRPSRPRGTARLILLAAVALAAAGLAYVLLGRGGDTPPAGAPVVPTPPAASGETPAEPVPDPFAWAPGRDGELSDRATAGASHGLYAFSPGGAAATAERVARRRTQIARAARRAGVATDAVEGLVFLESGGREDAIAPGGTEGAAGLTQIVAETGQSLLGMRIDVAASRRATRRIIRAERRGRPATAARYRAERRRVDERFDPAKALAATARYLELARERFGREDLALVSYHMGMGNLEGVLRDYSGVRDGEIRDVVEDERLTYARVYFDSTPLRHAAVQRRLAGLGDDSSNYLWKLRGAERIVDLWRDDRSELERLARLQTAKNSAEEVLHPPGDTARFATPEQLREARDAGRIVAFPDQPAVTGVSRDPRMGELAGRLGVSPRLYRGLRPGALAAVLYIGAQVRAISQVAPLVITSTVRDERYQAELVQGNREATRNYSLHTTGWAFDVGRTYRTRDQALAFQFILDRLQILDVVAWVREPGAIHVTASEDAGVLEPLLERLE